MEGVYKYVPKEIFPIDYGGSEYSVGELRGW